MKKRRHEIIIGDGGCVFLLKLVLEAVDVVEMISVIGGLRTNKDVVMLENLFKR